MFIFTFLSTLLKCIVVAALCLRSLGENRVRHESGLPDVTHSPLDPWSMASAIGGGSCARSSTVGEGTHVSSGRGSTPPNTAVRVRWCSAYTRFVTN